MVYLDFLFTSRMLIFREFGPKHKEYSNIQDVATRNSRILEIQQQQTTLEHSKTATPALLRHTRATELNV